MTVCFAFITKNATDAAAFFDGLLRERRIWSARDTALRLILRRARPPWFRSRHALRARYMYFAIAGAAPGALTTAAERPNTWPPAARRSRSGRRPGSLLFGPEALERPRRGDLAPRPLGELGGIIADLLLLAVGGEKALLEKMGRVVWCTRRVSRVPSDV